MIGRTLKQFRIVAKLGEGGMGAVYRAVDETLQREVALKVLTESLAEDEERRRRFLLEARSAAAVTHPNIATVYEIGETEGLVFIAMELVPGSTLRDRLLAGLPHGEAVRIAREIARGLGRAHEKGVVHRDLKPENVMITPEGDVKILDFGLAKLGAGQMGGGNVDPNAATQLTVEGRVLGTPGYMSPEQAEGKADVDARSDVFSFGSLLFEMLVGVPPFQGDSAIAILVGVLHHEPPPLDSLVPGVSPELSHVVARCLRKRREERFASGREIVQALGGEASTPSMRGVSMRPPPLAPQSTDAALGATVASDHQHVLATTAVPTVAAPKGAPARSWMGALFIVPVAFLFVGAAVFFSSRTKNAASSESPSTSSSAISATSSASSRSDGPKHGVALTDHPLPHATHPEAAAHYRFALSRLRIGAIDPYMELERAVGLDPTLAPAQLRMTLYATTFGPQLTAAERRTRFSKATALADSLDARDKALLPVAEAVSQDPIDFALAATHARAAWDKDPNDSELALLLFIYQLRANDKSRKDAKVTGRKVLDLDPLATRVYQLEAAQALGRQEFEEAASIVGQCLKVSPTASGCAMTRVQIDRDEGHCEDELLDAQALVRLEPDSMRPYTALAQALDATGARIEAVRNALDQAEARRQDGVTKEPPGLAKVALALRTGDFVGAEAALAALVPTLKDSTEQDHDSLAALQIAVAEETGNRAKALQIGLEFASGSRAWTQNAPLGVRTKVLYLRHEAGTMNDAAFEAARARHLVEQYKLLGTVSAERKDYWRLLIDARYGETPAEAKVALPADREVLPTLSPFELHEHAADYGRLLLLAGRIDPAVTALENQTKRCEGLPTALSVDLSKLDVILDYVHAHVLLGQALEARKDKDGACRAYRVVESRWKDAKPRSVTLEKAKERLRALACPAPH